MNFANPQILWLIPVVAALLTWFLWLSWRRKQKLVAQFVQSRLLAQLTVGVSKARQKFRLSLLVLSVALVLFAIAGPRWGFSWEEVRQRGLDIVVAIDTSRSMLAEDIAPNRLARAKLAALDLLKLAATDRLGLVAFAGSAFLQCPLTLDDEAYRQSVNLLTVGIIPQGGTALTEAIRTAQSAFKDEGDNDKVLVLFTDGEDHDSGAAEAAEEAAKKGLRIFTVGVGTAKGEMLRTKSDKNSQLEYIKDDDGNAVMSRLNESLLQEIATKARGFYLPLRGAGAMETLYRDGLATLRKADISSRFVKQYYERYQWPLGLAILLLLAEMFFPERRRISRTEEIAAAANSDLKKALTVALLLILPLSAQAGPTSALKKYANRQYEEALREYLALREKRPGDGRYAYNAGAAAYRAGQFGLAVTNLNAALATQDLPLPLQEKSYYNLGNALFRAGDQSQDPGEKSALWEQSIEKYESALKLDSNDGDAKFNRDLVKKRLEELKKQQSQNKDQKKDQDKDQKDQKDQDHSKDSQKQDQKDQGKDGKQDKDQQKQQDQQKSDSQSKDKQEQKKDPQQKDAQQQKQQKPKEQKQDQQKQAGQKPDPSENKSEGDSQAQQGQSVPLGQMTQQQAEQLLDSQKGEEKALLFIPAQEKGQARPLRFRDW